MLYSHFSKYTPVAGLIAAILAAPVANAAPPSQNIADAAFMAGAIQLSTAQLAAIRGGFDIGPTLSFDFAFQQIDTVNGALIQSVMVPTVTLTPSSVGVPVTVTNANGSTNTFTSTRDSNIALSNVTNNGMTRIASNLGGSGISNVISNQANNAMVGVATTMNIGISGMSQWLAQQQINTNIQNSLYHSNSGFK